MSDELHIVSLIVHAMPASISALGAVIDTLPDARIHGAHKNGKLIVTLEALSSAEIMDQIATIQRANGVLNVAMVAQHIESLDSLNAELNHADYST